MIWQVPQLALLAPDIATSNARQSRRFGGQSIPLDRVTSTVPSSHLAGKATCCVSVLSLVIRHVCVAAVLVRCAHMGRFVQTIHVCVFCECAVVALSFGDTGW